MSAGSPLRLVAGFVIPADELRWRFETSGGPGGQHANKSATRAELSWDVAATTAIPQSTRDRLLERLGSRAPGGVVTVAAADTRSQWRNRSIARRRLEQTLDEALQVDRTRVATITPGAARRRRRDEKRRRAALKALRRPPEEEE